MTKTAIKYIGRTERLNNSKTVELLKGFLEKRSDILLAFLFGSFASKQITPYSDIDIALLFDQAPDIYGINNLKDELTLLLKKKPIL
jgi:predicted nucleotidyltransferase